VPDQEPPPPAVQRTEEDRVLEEVQAQMDEVSKLIGSVWETTYGITVDSQILSTIWT